MTSLHLHSPAGNTCRLSTSSQAVTGYGCEENPASNSNSGLSRKVEGTLTIPQRKGVRPPGLLSRITGIPCANPGGDDVDRSAGARPSGQLLGPQPLGIDSGLDNVILEQTTSGPDVKRASFSNSRPSSQVASATGASGLPAPVATFSPWTVRRVGWV